MCLINYHYATFYFFRKDCESILCFIFNVFNKLPHVTFLAHIFVSTVSKDKNQRQTKELIVRGWRDGSAAMGSVPNTLLEAHNNV